MKELKLIKRYQNRKLYDTKGSCYVTLDEISKMIRQGDEIQVIDNKTQVDITSSTLTQLLFESERRAKSQAPVELLKEIIRFGDGTVSGYVQNRLGNDYTYENGLSNSEVISSVFGQ